MVKIDFLIRTNRRSVGITINQNCEVIVKAPRKLPFDEIKNIVEKKANWIELHITRIRENQQLNQDILSYNDMLFCGQVYHIAFDDKAKEISLEPNYCVVPTRFREVLSRRISTWYKKNAYSILASRVQYFSVLMRLEPSNFKLTNAKTCWGTCNSNGMVSLNWRLIMLPHSLIDYVVVHELSHLVQLNHSKLFWQLVGSVLPDYNARRNELKKGDYLLSLYR